MVTCKNWALKKYEVEVMKIGDGYKVTDVGVIPEEWDVKSLKALTIGKPMYGANVAAVDYDGSLPRYVRITDIRDDGRLHKQDVKSFPDPNAGEYRLKFGDLCFARSGATVGKTYLYHPNDGECIFAGYLIKFVADTSLVFPEYLLAYTHSQWYYTWVKGALRQGAQPNINAQEYSSLQLPLPPLPEQQKIADILSTVDEHISETEELIEHTKTLKQGMMQRLLTKGIGHTEFKETEIGRIPLEWKIVPITDTAAFINGYPFKPEEWSQAGIPIIRIQNLTDPSKEYNFSEVRLDQSYKVSYGELLLSWSGTIGIYTWRGIDAYLNQHIYKVLPNALSVKDFLKHSLNFVVTRMAEKSHGSTMKHITKREMSTISVPLPPLSEQREISSFLTTIDDKIDAYQSKLEALNRLKSGLMQQLLTGRIRVKV